MDEVVADSDVHLIERDKVVMCMAQEGGGDDSPALKEKYRVVCVYDKYLNKWFMTGEKKRWGQSMSKEEKKKYKVGLRMIEEDLVDDYDDVALDSTAFKDKDICKVINGNDIVGVCEKILLMGWWIRTDCLTIGVNSNNLSRKDHIMPASCNAHIHVNESWSSH